MHLILCLLSLALPPRGSVTTCFSTESNLASLLASTTPQTIRVPAGEWEADQPLKPAAAHTVICDEGAVIRTTQAWIQTVPPRPFNLVEPEADGSMFIGCIFVKSVTDGPINGVGVIHTNGHSIEFERCRFATNRGDALYVGGTIALIDNAWTTVKGTSGSLLLSNFAIESAHRNGVSIVSATKVLIADGSVRNVKGVAPQGGIYIEPNPFIPPQPSDRLDDVVIRNVRIENVGGSGVWVVLKNLKKGFSPPISVTVLDIQCVGTANLHECVTVDGFGSNVDLPGTVTIRNVSSTYERKE